MKERKVYIIFTDTGTLFTKLIKMYTKQKFNHVSVSFDDQLNEIFSFGRKKTYNPFVGGFVKEKIAAGLFKKARCKVYSYTISESEYALMRRKVRQIEAMKDSYKYNLLGLFAIILNYNLQRKHAFFCSQFVAAVLNQKSGILDKSPSLCTPQDLMDLQQLQFVYQGDITLYPYCPKEAKEDNVALNFGKPILYNSADLVK